MAEKDYASYLDALVADLAQCSIKELGQIDKKDTLVKAASLSGIYRMLDLRASVSGENASFLPIGKTLPAIMAEKAQQSWLDYKLSSRDISSNLEESDDTLDSLKRSFGVPQALSSEETSGVLNSNETEVVETEEVSFEQSGASVDAMRQFAQSVALMQKQTRLEDQATEAQAHSEEKHEQQGVPGWSAASPYGFPVEASVGEDWESEEDVDFSSSEEDLNPFSSVSDSEDGDEPKEVPPPAGLMGLVANLKAQQASEEEGSAETEEDESGEVAPPAGLLGLVESLKAMQGDDSSYKDDEEDDDDLPEFFATPESISSTSNEEDDDDLPEFFATPESVSYTEDQIEDDDLPEFFAPKQESGPTGTDGVPGSTSSTADFGQLTESKALRDSETGQVAAQGEEIPGQSATVGSGAAEEVSLSSERASSPERLWEAEDLVVAGVNTIYSLIKRKGKK